MKAERKREALAQRRIGQVSPEARRYRERSTVERVNGRLKDEFGGRYVRVRGPGKVWCHLMFGILALTGAVDASDAISRSRWIPGSMSTRRQGRDRASCACVRRPLRSGPQIRTFPFKSVFAVG